VLLRLFEFLGGSQGCRAQLGTLRLVCKRWKGIAEVRVGRPATPRPPSGTRAHGLWWLSRANVCACMCGACLYAHPRVRAPQMDELWGPVTLDLWPVEGVERKEGGRGAGRPWASSLFKLCLYRAHCLQRAGVTIVTPQWPSHYDIRLVCTGTYWLMRVCPRVL
jgi:hypothetical protein